MIPEEDVREGDTVQVDFEPGGLMDSATFTISDLEAWKTALHKHRVRRIILLNRPPIDLPDAPFIGKVGVNQSNGDVDYYVGCWERIYDSGENETYLKGYGMSCDLSRDVKIPHKYIDSFEIMDVVPVNSGYVPAKLAEKFVLQVETRRVSVRDCEELSRGFKYSNEEKNIG